MPGARAGHSVCQTRRRAQAAFASARFLAISLFSLRAFGESSSAWAFAKNASRPPRWSTLLSAFAEMRSLTERPSASEISVTLSRFGRKRRLVLMFEWLTLWPTWGPLPVKSQRRDIVEILENSAGTPAAPIRRPIGNADV